MEFPFGKSRKKQEQPKQIQKPKEKYQPTTQFNADETTKYTKSFNTVKPLQIDESIVVGKTTDKYEHVLKQPQFSAPTLAGLREKTKVAKIQKLLEVQGAKTSEQKNAERQQRMAEDPNYFNGLAASMNTVAKKTKNPGEENLAA